MMKKAMKAALCILSAITMAAGSALNASAGTLSREELIEKYAPNGAYDTHISFAPGTPISYYDAEGEMLDLVGLAQADVDALIAQIENGALTDAEIDIQIAMNLQKNIERAKSADSKAMLFNDYRRGIDHEQWFVNAEYADGFYYVLREDGTASIVGAEQADFAGKAVMEIPAEIGGVTVTEIGKRAFEQAYSFFPDVNEIILPDTVEAIAEGAFSMALIGRNCRINLPENLKYIGRCAFYHSAQWVGDEFNVIKLPESVEFIGLRAFSVPEGYSNDQNDPNYRIHGFQQTVDCILDMPESLVMLEENCVDADAVREANGIGLSEQLKGITYAEAYNGSAEDAAAISIEWWKLGVRGAEDVLAFCAKYDMTRQRIYSRYLFGYSEYCTFLYDEGNYIDMNDVIEYYSIKEPKPAPVAALAGDVNGDGKVDVSDSVLLARYCAEDDGITLTADGKLNADANGDGSITLDDVTEILRIVAKL